jgi:hypothetical protein
MTRGLFSTSDSYPAITGKENEDVKMTIARNFWIKLLNILSP